MRLDDVAVFVVGVGAVKLLLLPLSFGECDVELECVVTVSGADAAADKDEDIEDGTGCAVAVAAAVSTTAESISHFGHRISLLFDVWHCSCNEIAARVAKRIPQLLILHLVVMTLFLLLIPS